MPGSSTDLRGNNLFLQSLYLTVTPPATVTTAVITQQNVTVTGLVPGDIVNVNMTTFTSNLLSIANAYVSANNTLTLNWTSEAGNISSAAAQTLLVSVLRPENIGAGGVTLLPNVIQ